MAAAAEIGGFTAAALRPLAHPAPAAAPRRAVAAQSLRTTATETLTADLAASTANGAVHAQVSGIL
jgi:pyruvate kinase